MFSSPEKHCPTAMPYCIFQGNVNPKDLKQQIATQSFFFSFIFDTNQGRQTEIYAPELRKRK